MASTHSLRPSWARRILKAIGFSLCVLAIAGAGTWLILAYTEHLWPFEEPPPPLPEFQPERYLLPEEPFTEFPVVSVAKANETLKPEELVLGVTIGDESRAYPLNVLIGEPRRKAVNDTLGGQAIVATWCDACHSGIVYARTVDERTLTFGISGQLWKDSMVIYDEQTMTLWSQLGGEAKQGQLKGKQLHRLPSLVTDWGSWRRLYPKSTVLLLPTAHRMFFRDFYRHPEKYVLGIGKDPLGKAWGLDVLRQRRVVNDQWDGKPVVVVFDEGSATAALYERQLGTEVLTFRWDDGKVVDEKGGSTWNPITGEADTGPLHGRRLHRLPAVLATRTAWDAFHPSSKE